MLLQSIFVRSRQEPSERQHAPLTPHGFVKQVTSGPSQVPPARLQKDSVTLSHALSVQQAAMIGVQPADAQSEPKP